MNAYEKTTIGNYTIERALARATSIDGHVLLGTDTFGAKRAIKIGAPGTEDRIANEAKTLTTLRHPNIITPCETGTHHGAPYLTLTPYCPTTLEQRIKEKPLTAEETRAVAHDLLSALHYSHKHGIVHADLAPRHVLFTEQKTLILCDFGNTNAPNIESSVASVKRLGSMPYMNTDQLMGKTPTPKTDLYAAGMVLAHAHNGALWDRFTPPSKDPHLAELIHELINPNGYQTAKEALNLTLDPNEDELRAENKQLWQEKSTLQRKLESAQHWTGIKTLLALGTGLTIGHALNNPAYIDKILAYCCSR